MKNLALTFDYSWPESKTKSANKPRRYRLRAKNQSPVVAIIKILLVLGMGLGALIRFIVELTQSLP
jgi:hypothetical protein